jgi:dTDP-4-dehydrorhamnose reductase
MTTKRSVRVLLLGHDGQVGWALRRRLPERADVTAVSYPDVDYTRPADLRNLVRSVAPDVIINAAAYTSVDRAESEPEQARLINTEGPGLLAVEAGRIGATLVHYSTDFVFDGNQTRPYREDDEPCPISVYGRTKLAGDRAVLAAGGKVLVFRISWIYGLRGRNFLLTMRRLAREGRALRVVDDQVGSPTWCGSVAAATCEVLARVAFGEAPVDVESVAGLYNMACAGETSWYGFAKAFLAADTPVEPIQTDAYPTPATRPRYSVLDCTRLRDRFGISMPRWQEALQACLSEAAGSLP